jgi:hypothetical protein
MECRQLEGNALGNRQVLGWSEHLPCRGGSEPARLTSLLALSSVKVPRDALREPARYKRPVPIQLTKVDNWLEC